MDERERRIGLNEALFREVNERVREVRDGFEVQAPRLEVVCECGDQGCLEHVEMTVTEYETLRSDPTLFAVRPEHNYVEVERVVSHGDRFWTVRKHPGGPADLAERRDPRA